MSLARSLSIVAASAAETGSAASQVRRYFQEAFPLHIADEEELIEPLLRLRAPELDDSLSNMKREHRDQEEAVARLLSLCSIVEASPHRLTAVQHHLKTITDGLRVGLESHLAEEERILFPALSRVLSRAELDSVLVAMRLRRERALSST